LSTYSVITGDGGKFGVSGITAMLSETREVLDKVPEKDEKKS
jgi:hypothetical protein